MFEIKMFICTVRAIITILMFARCYHATTLRVHEGERAQLDFLYPCNSTEVTLQRSHAAPFYSSENPDSISQSNKIVTNDKNNTTCFLHLMIYPVSRSDQGTYIPIAYKNGHMITPQEDGRIWLGIDYPPDKASCDSPTDYITGEWVKMDCTASKGTVPGQIVCYQNGMRLPHQALPQETATKVDQNILARLAYPVYCCSSTLTKIKARCECTDWGWDPLDGLLNNIDPCAAAPTTTSSPSSKGNGVEITTSIPLLQVTTVPVIYPFQIQNCEWSLTIPITFLSFAIMISVFNIIYFVYKYWRKKSKNSPQKRKDRSKTKDTQLSDYKRVIVMKQDEFFEQKLQKI